MVLSQVTKGYMVIVDNIESHIDSETRPLNSHALNKSGVEIVNLKAPLDQTWIEQDFSKELLQHCQHPPESLISSDRPVFVTSAPGCKISALYYSMKFNFDKGCSSLNEVLVSHGQALKPLIHDRKWNTKFQEEENNNFIHFLDDLAKNSNYELCPLDTTEIPNSFHQMEKIDIGQEGVWYYGLFRKELESILGLSLYRDNIISIVRGTTLPEFRCQGNFKRLFLHVNKILQSEYPEFTHIMWAREKTSGTTVHLQNEGFHYIKSEFFKEPYNEYYQLWGRSPNRES